MHSGGVVTDTVIWEQTNWFAVEAKPHREEFAAASVAKLEVEILLPKIKKEQLICGIPRVVTKALFGGYFFARFCPGVLLDAVSYAPGVIRVIGNRRFPIPLEENIIPAIRARIMEDGFVKLQPSAFQPGDRVGISEGAWEGTIG